MRTLINDRCTVLAINPKPGEVSRAILWLCLNRTVELVIPRLSEYQVGIETINGARVLVPSALKTIQPVQGDAQ